MVGNPLISKDVGLRIPALGPSEIDVYGKPRPSEIDVKPWLLGGRKTVGTRCLQPRPSCTCARESRGSGVRLTNRLRPRRQISIGLRRSAGSGRGYRIGQTSICDALTSLCDG